MQTSQTYEGTSNQSQKIILRAFDIVNHVLTEEKNRELLVKLFYQNGSHNLAGHAIMRFQHAIGVNGAHVERIL